MADVTISDHSIEGWAPLREQFGFVPDPMILRSAEIFLNGLSGAAALDSDEWRLLSALRENTGGISDFFDMLVTRERIPLINYQDTFDRNSIGFTSIEVLLGTRGATVEIGYDPYQEIKAGALVNLGRLDLTRLENIASLILEMGAFGWEWRPKMEAFPDVRTVALDDAQDTVAALDPILDDSGILPFLLGGLIFSGMAQAADAVHHVQGKRARMFLGLAGAERDEHPMTHEYEEQIFRAAMDDLAGPEAKCRLAESAPPVLPYLISLGEVDGPKELFERALEFRASDLGRAYRAFATDLRGDGLKARQAEAISAKERARAAAEIRPPDYRAERSQALNVEFGIGLAGPDVKVSGPVQAPGWLRNWWNDNIPFNGGLRKTLRRMWLADGAYANLQGQLDEIWRNG